MRLTATFLAILVTTPAHAFIAQNGLVVEADGPTGFTVPWRGKGGPVDFWCAAGDYAVRVLHLPPSQEIFRVSEPPRRPGEPIRFSLRPEAAASGTGLTLLWNDDGGITVGHAQSLCEIERSRR